MGWYGGCEHSIVKLKIFTLPFPQVVPTALKINAVEYSTVAERSECMGWMEIWDRVFFSCVL